METTQSCAKAKSAALFKKPLIFLLTLLLGLNSYGIGPSSSLTLGLGTDSEKSPSGFIDAQFLLPSSVIISVGASSTRVNFEEQGEGASREFYVGLGSDPMRDWVFGVNLEVADPSDHMKVTLLSASMQYFWEDFSIKWVGGIQQIRAEVTERLYNVCALVSFQGVCSIVQISADEVVDRSAQWGVLINYFATEHWSFRANYYDYTYQKDLSLFTDERIVNVDYYADTISYASGFLDHRYGVGASYDWKDYSLSLDWSHLFNEFNNDETRQWVVSFGLKISKKWDFLLTQGLSQSEAETEEQPISGSFTNMAISWSW